MLVETPKCKLVYFCWIQHRSAGQCQSTLAFHFKFLLCCTVCWWLIQTLICHFCFVLSSSLAWCPFAPPSQGYQYLFRCVQVLVIPSCHGQMLFRGQRDVWNIYVYLASHFHKMCKLQPNTVICFFSTGAFSVVSCVLEQVHSNSVIIRPLPNLMRLICGYVCV